MKKLVLLLMTLTITLLLPKSAIQAQDETYVVVENMPQFPGGTVALQKYIAKNVKYPKRAEKEKAEGKVFVNFVVDKQGSVKNVKVIRGAQIDLNNEAVRVIKSLPKWKPGTQKGKPVNVSFTVPISFSLNNKSIEVYKGNIGSTYKITKNHKQKDLKAKNGDCYVVVNNMPEFPGGTVALQKYIANNIKYPKVHQESNISGKVFINFVVNEKGKVINVRVVRGVDPALDKEAVRVISNLPNWKPGSTKDGKKVKVSFTVPVSFSLK